METDMVKFDYEKRCAKCVYSICDMDHITTIPTIHICYNRKSEHYEKRTAAWSSSCSEFLSEKRQREIIMAAWDGVFKHGDKKPKTNA